jgi:hypothetical protein
LLSDLRSQRAPGRELGLPGMRAAPGPANLAATPPRGVTAMPDLAVPTPVVGTPLAQLPPDLLPEVSPSGAMAATSVAPPGGSRSLRLPPPFPGRTGLLPVRIQGAGDTRLPSPPGLPATAAPLPLPDGAPEAMLTNLTSGEISARLDATLGDGGLSDTTPELPALQFAPITREQGPVPEDAMSGVDLHGSLMPMQIAVPPRRHRWTMIVAAGAVTTCALVAAVVVLRSRMVPAVPPSAASVGPGQAAPTRAVIAEPSAPAQVARPAMTAADAGSGPDTAARPAAANE